MRAVCGRLKSNYRYSKDIVYNNFPWPSPTAEQKAKIEQSALAILHALVMHAGGYTFADYVKVGLPLQIILGIVMTIVLPLLFPF